MMLFESVELVSIILFVAGMVLLLIELFIPGFGIFGGLGLVALVLCIVFQAKTWAEAIIMVAVITAIVIAISLVAARSFKRGWLYRSSLVLKDAEESKSGYVSSSDYSHLFGKTGRSITPLRPAGSADFDGIKTDVVTEGEFIPAKSDIVVLRVEGSRIFVRQLED